MIGRIRLFARALVCLAVMAIAIVGPARAGELPAAAGQVVLTVAGNIDRTNRGPYDAFEDAFLKYHERSFTRAVEFDLAMLEALGLHETTLEYKKWPGAIRFSGPWLKDVLAAAGAVGKPVTFLALDGFAVEVSKEELAAQPWILAIRRDGRYLNIGQRGPAWVVYARDSGAEITEDDESKWPWATFFIEVR